MPSSFYPPPNPHSLRFTWIFLHLQHPTSLGHYLRSVSLSMEPTHCFVQYCALATYLRTLYKHHPFPSPAFLLIQVLAYAPCFALPLFLFCCCELLYPLSAPVVPILLPPYFFSFFSFLPIFVSTTARTYPMKGMTEKKKEKGRIHEDRYDRNACIRSISHLIFRARSTIFCCNYSGVL